MTCFKSILVMVCMDYIGCPYSIGFKGIELLRGLRRLWTPSNLSL